MRANWIFLRRFACCSSKPNLHANYFVMLRVPEEYDINQSILHKNFKTIQQKYHPDKSKDKDALAISSTINQAYATLKDPVQRAIYMLTNVHNQPIDTVTLSPKFLEMTYIFQEVALEGTEHQKEETRKECQAAFDTLVEQITLSLDAQEFQVSAQQTKQLLFLQKCLEKLNE
jgi:molecular chaperone HscB